MLSDYLILAGTVLAAVVVVALVALKGWQGWLALKARELEQFAHNRPQIDGGATTGLARIEISDLKERIRKLEAIAAGVDL